MSVDERDHLLLAAYLDGELSPGETIDMERRLAEDADLRQLSEELGGLSRAVRDLVAATPVPEGLDESITARLATIEPLPARRAARSWLPMAACLLIGLAGGGAIGYGLAGLPSEAGGDPRLDAIYAGHIRGLAAPEPFDIASSDRHVVKPWFNGRTVVAPDAPDFGPEGFPLAGGRVDVVDGEKVPTLVYRRRQHVISVTVTPQRGEGNTLRTRREGSNLIGWNAGDLAYVVVSDLNAAELQQFADLFRARTAPQP